MELGRGKVDRLSLDICQVRIHSLFIQNNGAHTRLREHYLSQALFRVELPDERAFLVPYVSTRATT